MDEIIEKIKSLPPLVALSLAFVMGISYNVHSFFQETPLVEQEVLAAEQERDVAKNQYTKAKTDAEKLIKLEVTLKTIREQLERAKKYLPDEIHVDEVLHTAARLCKQYSVSLDSFTPQKEEPSNTDARYTIKPISVTLTGRFVDIARFFDSMVHLEKIVHIRNIDLEKSGKDEFNRGGDNRVDLYRLSPEQRQKYAERNTQVKATADLLLFRSEA